MIKANKMKNSKIYLKTLTIKYRACNHFIEKSVLYSIATVQRAMKG